MANNIVRRIVVYIAIKEYLDTMDAKHIGDTVKVFINDIENTITSFDPANHNHGGAYQPVDEYVTDIKLVAKDYADKPVLIWQQV